jgi:hypothetical protein
MRGRERPHNRWLFRRLIGCLLPPHEAAITQDVSDQPFPPPPAPSSDDRILREIDARARIADLLVRSCRAVDDRDPGAVAALFLTDAEIADDVSGRTFPTAAAFVRFAVGRAAAGTTRHVLEHGEIAVDGTRATSRSSVTVEHARSGGRCVTIGGRYEDELRETPAGWRIARRRFRADWIGEGRLAAGAKPGRPVLWLAGPQPTKRTTITAW